VAAAPNKCLFGGHAGRPAAATQSNGNFNPSTCPGVEGLTEEDWAKLDELVMKAQAGSKPN